MSKSPMSRYVPLLAVFAVQLLIVIVAPSVQREESVSTTAAPGIATPAGGSTTGGIATPATGGSGSGGVATPVVPGSPGTTVAGSPATGSGSSGSSGSTGGAGSAGSGGTDTSGGAPSGGGDGAPAPAAAAGDTSHCVGDRQYDPAIDFYAPPCVAKSDGTNPGDTYQGVSGETITLVKYYDLGDPAVNAVLDAQGSFVTADEHRQYLEKVVTFINENYELYGRKVEIEVFEGQCRSIPPDVSCIQNEFRELVSEKQPFAVMWNTNLCSQCYAELSKLKTINLGGWNYGDTYTQRWAPYHWDYTMSGTRLAQHAGEFWCKQLEGGNAVYSRSYPDSPRLLGVLATNDPENQATVEVDLAQALQDGCGASFGNRTYFYEQDISTADTQRRAGVLAMRGSAIDPDDDATSVMCFCDLVAPAFLYQEEDTQQYYPENLVTGYGFMDVDASAQAYVGGVGCPQGSPCAFDGAFGFRSANQTIEFGTSGKNVWTAAGGEGNPPLRQPDGEWTYWNIVASGIQMAGPGLTPDTFAQGLYAMGPRGDATHKLRQFSPGNNYWTQEVDTVYWSNTTASPYNGENGSYVSVSGNRQLGGWPAEALQLPPMPR